ncbi:uncharacterized protein [Macrobrachium rosenbergii]|uniref:uncharacterized protein n=1 Tax=Macrobrachium rosenbergii TaxID=79674 RepID=UPI0034D70951
MNSLKEGLAATLVLILLQIFVHVAEGGPVQPNPIDGPFFSPLEKKDVNDDDITERFNSKIFRDMVYTSHDLTALESLQKSSAFPPEALGDGDAWEVVEAKSTLSGGEGQERVSSAPDKENHKDRKEKYIWIATPNWTRSWKAAQRDAAETARALFTQAEKLSRGEDKTAFFDSDESMKRGKKEKYIWTATPNWTGSWRPAQRGLAATAPVTAFPGTEIIPRDGVEETFVTPFETKKEKYVWMATPNWTRSWKTALKEAIAAQKEASSLVPSFTESKEVAGAESKEGSSTDASEHKKDKYVWYAVPEWTASPQATPDSDDGTPTSDVARHHRQKRFVTPYKLRLIAVPVSIFNYLGFLPIKIPGLPYHDELPPPDYTYYNTMHDLRTPERVKYFF